jgi:DNA polymerase-3 subunit gamma/tau
LPQPESSPDNPKTYTALYRRWRPQLFSQVVGQKHVTRTLQNALSSGRVAHAYLFCGLRGTGKTTMAKLLARALNCREGVHPEPCNSCPSCLEILEGRSVDVLEIDAASNRGIDEIRDLRDKARYTTAQSRYKVYIVDEVHMLTNEAFNALLKILEEPPPRVIFILATTEIHKLPLTVVSRCQRFDFHLLGISEIAGHLQNVAAELDFNLDEEALYLLARQAEGSMRDALGFLEQCRAYGGEKVSYSEVRDILGLAAPETIFSLLEAVIQEDIGRGLSVIGASVYEGRDLHRFIRELILYLRKLVVLQSGEDEEKILADVPGLKPYLIRHRGKFDSAVLLEMLEILQELTFQLRNSSQPQFLLELTFLRLVRAWRFRQYLSPGSLFQRLEELEEKLQAAAQLPIATAKVKEAGTVKEEVETAAEEEMKDIRQYSGETSRGTAETAPPGQKNAATGQQPSVAREPVAPAAPTETAETAAEPAEPVEIAESKTTEKIETAETGTLPDGAAASPGSPGEVSAQPGAGPPPESPLPPAPRLGEKQPQGTSPRLTPAPPGEASTRPGAAPPPEEATPPAAPRAGSRDLQGAELQEFWEKQLLPEIKKQRRHVLHALLQEASPLSCKGGIFTFAFPPTHDIHKSRTESPRHRKYLESLLSTMLGTKTSIRIMLQENEKEKENSRESAGEKPTKTASQTISIPAPQKDSPKDTPVAGPAGNASRGKQADDYYMQQMVDLFNGKLLATGTEELDSRDFWKWDTPPEEK